MEELIPESSRYTVSLPSGKNAFTLEVIVAENKAIGQ